MIRRTLASVLRLSGLVLVATGAVLVWAGGALEGDGRPPVIKSPVKRQAVGAGTPR